MSNQITVGQNFPALSAQSIHGDTLTVPAPDAHFTHLQFRRFAGCPVCNLHLRSFVVDHSKLEAAGVREIVVFHSRDEELLPYQGQFPFAVIGDPQKSLYKRYGVESSLRALLDPRAWGALLLGNLARDKPKANLSPEGGVLGLPADFLIAADGTVKAANYGKHADDQWSVDEVIALTR